MIKTKNPKKAFTIVELVIVIAVVAILMTIMFVGGTAISNNAKMSTAKSDLRTAEVNIKAALQDPEFVLDENTTAKKILDQLNAYMEDDMKLVEAYEVTAENKDALGYTDAKALTLEGNEVADYVLGDTNSNCMRFVTAKTDPFGMRYVLEVEDFSTTDKDTSWLFTFKSFGKNKTNAKLTASTYVNGLRYEADDICQFIRFVNSSILSDKYLGSGNKCDQFNDLMCIGGDAASLGHLLQYTRIGTDIDGIASEATPVGNLGGNTHYNNVPVVANP